MDRIRKAHALVQMGLTKVLSTKDGKVTYVSVPGTNSKIYDVIIRRHRTGVVSTECRVDTGHGHIDCPGNGKTVCYHSVAAVITAVEFQNRKFLGVSKNKVDAKRLSNIGGKVVTLTSFQGGTPMYAVIR